MKKSSLLIFVLFNTLIFGQLYFPPTTGNQWNTRPLSDFNWCQDKVDNLYALLTANNTKSFILLKDGKIVLEQYFDGHTATSPWYWASAGKTLTATMVGIAQQENFLNINNKSSDYLGVGWTSCTLAQENAITVRHQLTMTTGLNDGVSDQTCYAPSCFQYLAPPGTRWAYHNGPYTILDQVVANATGVSLNQYTTSKLKTPTGMTGNFIAVDNNNVFWSTARSMARFGLLMLNGGNWNGNQILNTNYFNQMVNTSQNINKSYGYLWWLTGKESFMVPQLQVTFPGNLMPNAPADTYMALGKNGQLINVVPSQNLVFIRMGEAPSNDLVPFLLNDQIWGLINDLGCNMSTTSFNKNDIILYPNPAPDMVHVNLPNHLTAKDCTIHLISAQGQILSTVVPEAHQTSIDLKGYAAGTYLIYVFCEGEIMTSRLIKK
jgi:CubicO group peptidase (beta-lactamase class C family)